MEKKSGIGLATTVGRAWRGPLALLPLVVFVAGGLTLYSSAQADLNCKAEPCYQRAVAHWPDLLRPIAYLGCKDHLDEFAVMWNGNIGAMTSTLTEADRRQFTERRKQSLQASFAIGDRPKFDNRTADDQSRQASLRGGWLPMTEIRMLEGDVVLRQEAFVCSREGNGTAGWDVPVFLRVRFSVEKAGSGASPIGLWMQVARNHTSYSMSARRNVRISRIAPEYAGLQARDRSLADSSGAVVMACDQSFKFHPRLPESLATFGLAETAMDRNLCEFRLPRQPGASLEMVFPFLPVQPEAVQSVRNTDYEKGQARIEAFWRSEVSRGMQVETPEEEINNLWRFSIPLTFINADAYSNGDVVLKTSPHHYEGYWATPTMMNLLELAQRGYREQVLTYLEPFAHPERWKPVPNTGMSFQSTKGFIGGPSEHMRISWVSDHGAVLWLASEYYLLTRDEKFLERWLPILLEGLEWIAHEREQTKTLGGVAAGLMPEGRATDANSQAHYVWSDAWTFRGLDAVCRVLRAKGHKDTGRWERERDDYRSTFDSAFRKAIKETMRWTDSNGVAIPFVPYELNQKTPTGHAFYLDTGPMFLGVAGLLPPQDDTMTWAMKWLTEGPDAGKYNPDWSDLGDTPSLVFEMSSCEPAYSWNLPLRFLRNESDRFLEGFYSLCAGAVSRRFLEGCETRDGIIGLPVTNAVIGNHLRNMLVFDDEKSGSLELLRNAPRRWLLPGKAIRVRGAETYFGLLSYRVDTTQDGTRVEIDCPERQPVNTLRLHLRLPDQRTVRSVTVNGKRLKPGRDGVVEVDQPTGKLKVVTEF
jgi:hypothetical protein